MAASMQLQPAEVYFAQKLAANEKKIRDRAVKKLRKYISVRSQSVGFSEDDMLKIWKGLHYCMWMCDKPLVQEDLADTLANLLQCFDNNAQAFLFIDAFFQTQCREWFGIDRLRLDKFMMLIRRVIHQCLLMLKIKKWKVTLVKQFLSILEKYVISDSDNAGPDGLKFHLADIYLDELSSVGIDSLKPDTLQIFLEPYCTMMTRCQNKHLVSHVVNRIFKNIIDQSDVGKDEEEDVSEDEGEEENQDTDKAPKLQFDYTTIADKLFDLAKGNNCLSRNRPAIYDLVKRFKDLAAGIFPSDDIIGSSDEDDPISNADFNMAVQRLRKVEKMGIKKKKTKKKRKLEETHEGSEEEPKKKKKKKSKQEVKEDESQINGILDKEPPKKKKNKCKSEQQSKSESNDKNDELEGEGHSTTRNLANNSQKKSRKLKNAADNADSLVGGIGESNGVVSTKKDKKRKNNALQISDGVPTDELPKKMKKDQSSIEKKHSQNVKESQSVKKKKNKKSEKEPGAVIEEMLQVNGQHEETNNLVHLQEKSSSPSDEVNHSVKKKKNEKNNKEPANGSVVEETTCTTAESPKNHVQKGDESFVLDTNFSQSSLMTDSVKKTKNKKKKKGKVSAVDGPTTSEENNKDFTSEKQTAKIEEADPGLKTNTAKGEPHKEETTKEHKETTINISSKKRKTGSSVSNVELTMTPKVKDHGKKSKAVTTPNSFATFENVTPTPPLFVRKAASKVKETPKTEPRKAKLNLVTPDMEAPASEGKKRVSFIMSRNIAQEFKESLKPSPTPAFNPEKLPEQGILKTPPSGGAIYKRTRSAVKAKRAKAADFF